MRTIYNFKILSGNYLTGNRFEQLGSQLCNEQTRPPPRPHFSSLSVVCKEIRTGQDRAGQDRTGHNSLKSNVCRHCQTNPLFDGIVWHGMAWHGIVVYCTVLLRIVWHGIVLY